MLGRRTVAVLTLVFAVLCQSTPSDCRAGCLDCLFGKRKSAKAAVAATPAPTVAYAPAASSCGAAFCEQTVVRYVPQIAYRTAFQPVPVTTYQTTTSINPANGLPMRCTRPCTSYSYQARRVAYTTYRPVYTTVPVTPTSGLPANPGQAAASLVPGYTPSNATLAPSGYAPPASNCTGCQVGGLQAAPVLGSVCCSSSAARSNALAEHPIPDALRGAAAPSADPYGATPWQAVEGPTVAPPTSQTPADIQPSLRPTIDDFPPLQPVPQTSPYLNGQDSQGGVGNSSFGEAGRQGSQSRSFSEPSDSRASYGERPRLEEPTTNRQTGFDSSGYNSRAVPDLDRQRPPRTRNVPLNESQDKTARSARTRFASAPTPFPQDSSTASRQTQIQSAGGATLLPPSHDRESFSGPGNSVGSRGSRWNDGGWVPSR